MANKKGNEDNLTNKGKGRPLGSKNKFTKLKEDWLETFDELGGVKALTQWAKDNPTDYYKTATKLFPKEIDMNVESEGGVVFLPPKEDKEE